MRQVISISLPESVKKQLDGVVAEEHVNRSDVVREALRRYLANREFQRLRGLMTAEAEKRGIYTDEDVFKALK